VSLHGTALAIYAAIKDDQSALDQIRSARSALALALATDPNASMSVTSGTMNGQTFSAIAGIRPADRLKVLSLVCRMEDAGTAISSQTVPIL